MGPAIPPVGREGHASYDSTALRAIGPVKGIPCTQMGFPWTFGGLPLMDLATARWRWRGGVLLRRHGMETRGAGLYLWWG